MNYVSQSRRPNAGALLGALAIPAGFGAALIIGLAFTVVVVDPPTALKGYEVTPVDIPPLPPEPQPERDPSPAQTTQAPKPVVLDTPIIIATRPVVDVSPIGELSDDLITLPFPSGLDGNDSPLVSPALPDPVVATPQGNPGAWIQERDYRSNWIRQGLSGVAGFTLQIDARGRVSDCTITRSTGHEALDGATCRLLKRRARFDPARDPAGNRVAGSYSSSVAWEIP